jgi:hypothetical protein
MVIQATGTCILVGKLSVTSTVETGSERISFDKEVLVGCLIRGIERPTSSSEDSKPVNIGLGLDAGIAKVAAAMGKNQIKRG